MKHFSNIIVTTFKRGLDSGLKDKCLEMWLVGTNIQELKFFWKRLGSFK